MSEDKGESLGSSGGGVSMLKLENRGLERLMAASGYFLIVGAMIPVLVISYKYHIRGGIGLKIGDDQSVVSFLFANFTVEILLVLSSFLLGSFGLRLLYGANREAHSAIPEEDRTLLEPLIRDAKKEAVDQYVVLSSLRGFTGTFQKIGFSGLPLATVTLTIVFSLLSFSGEDSFIDLTKLTLGAFIGSFVQKGADPVSNLREREQQTKG